MNTPKITLLLIALGGSLALAQAAGAADAPVAPAAPPSPVAPAATVQSTGHEATLTLSSDGKHAVALKAEIKDALRKHAAAKDAESGADTTGTDEADAADTGGDTGEHARSRDSLVEIGHDASLEAGRHAQAVVAVMGNASSAGEVDEAVVAVLGDARSTGTVGDSVIAVLGNNYVDGPVRGSVVAVLGNVELGPNAVVEGEVVAVGGALKRDTGAIVHGDVQEVNVFGAEGVSSVGAGLNAWVRHCLLLGRPLAFGPHLAWAWELAALYLAGYLLIALLFPTAMSNCLATMERRPGRSILAAVLAVPLKYVAFILLAVTGVGLLLIPFAALALWLGGALGKAVAFAWIGQRLLPRTDSREPGRLVLATLVGALLATVFYVIPFVGFFVYKALAVLGLGIVVYTLVLHWFPEDREPGVGGRGGPTGLPPAGGQPAPAAQPAAGAEAVSGEAPLPGAAPSAAPDAAPDAAPGGAAAAAAAGPSVVRGPAVSDAAGSERASFWIRMGALLIDVVLVGIVHNVLPFPDHSMLPLVAIYGAIMWKLRGTTVGGVICHLRLVRLDGQPIDWGTATVRALGCFLSLLAAGLGFLWILWDPERQAWHDKIAGTVVVRDARSRPLV